MNDTKTKDKSSESFKEFMNFRRQTIVEIAEHTGISKRTIQGYAQGKPPFKNAPAKNLIAITDYMEIDPHYMMGYDEWKVSEYLENIIKENRLRTINDMQFLDDDVRLTERTKTYREEQKEKRKQRKLERLAEEPIDDTASDEAVGVMDPELQETQEAQQEPTLKSGPDMILEWYDMTEGSMSDREERRIRAFIEVFKMIEKGSK